jgi:hypothetical protein
LDCRKDIRQSLWAAHGSIFLSSGLSKFNET